MDFNKDIILRFLAEDILLCFLAFFIGFCFFIATDYFKKDTLC